MWSNTMHVPNPHNDTLIPTPARTTWLWICDSAQRCQSAVRRPPLSVRVTRRWRRFFSQRRFNPLVDGLCKRPHANVPLLLPLRFWQAGSSFAGGPGGEGCLSRGDEAARRVRRTTRCSGVHENSLHGDRKANIWVEERTEKHAFYLFILFVFFIENFWWNNTLFLFSSLSFYRF